MPKCAHILGATAVKPEYGVVVHRASTSYLDLNNQKQAKEYFKEKNGKDLQITRITPLLRKPRNPDAPSQSVIVFVEEAEQADNLIRRGAKVGHRQLGAQRYTPQAQLKQCFNCQGYRHKAVVCTRKARCGRCSEEHQTKECKDPATLKCALCGGKHHAWAEECEKRKQEIARLQEMRDTVPITFNPSAQ